MSPRTAGNPATVVRVALGQTLRYQAIARSGSTVFKPTWWRCGIAAGVACAGARAGRRSSPPKAMRASTRGRAIREGVCIRSA